MVQVKLFGHPQVSVDGSPVTDFLSNKVRAILYRLAYTEGAIPRSQLAAQCWGDVPEKQANKNLRQALYDIQQQVPLVVTRQTAALEGLVDARAFLAAIANGEHQQASDLYTGDLLIDFSVNDAPDFMAWLDATRQQMRQLALRALQTVLQRTDLSHDQRMTWLKQAVALEPMGERLQRALIEQLARAGEFTAALAQYEQLHTAMAETLGVAPTAETTRLVAKIKRAQQRGKPTHSTGAAIIGRNQELSQLQTWLANGERLITICGPGGIGKTSLANALVGDANPLDDLYFVALADAESFEDALTQIATAYGLPSQSAQQLVQQLTGVLILDNCEQLMGEQFVAWVVAALAAAPQLQLVLTSREQLFLQHERVLLLDGLRDEDEAIALFVQSARRVDDAFRPNRATLQQIAAIAKQVDGLPLALEIAGSLVNQFSVATIAAKIGTAETDDLPDRQRSLQAVFDYSWGLLTSAERQLFINLAIFRGSFDLAAAKSITGAKPLTLRALIHKSLLQFDPNSGRYTQHDLLHQYASGKLSERTQLQAAHTNYYVNFLAQRVTAVQQNDSAALREIAAEYSNIRAMWLHACEQRDQMALFRCYLPFTYFLEETWRHKEAQTLFQIAQNQFDQEPNAPDAQQPFLVGAFALALANSTARLGDYVAARQFAERGLAISNAQNIQLGVAHGRLLMGRIALLEGEWQSAETHLRALDQIGRNSPFALTVARGQLRLAEALFAQGKMAAATAKLHDVLPHLPERGALYAHLLLGEMLQDEYHWEQAVALADVLQQPSLQVEARLAIVPHKVTLGALTEARALLAEIERREAWLVFYAFDLLLVRATLQTAIGDYQTAHDLLQQAETQAAALQSIRAQLRVQYQQGVLLAARGLQQRAEQLLAQVAQHPNAHWRERQPLPPA